MVELDVCGGQTGSVMEPAGAGLMAALPGRPVGGVFERRYVVGDGVEQAMVHRRFCRRCLATACSQVRQLPPPRVRAKVARTRST